MLVGCSQALLTSTPTVPPKIAFLPCNFLMQEILDDPWQPLSSSCPSEVSPQASSPLGQDLIKLPPSWPSGLSAMHWSSPTVLLQPAALSLPSCIIKPYAARVLCIGSRFWSLSTCFLTQVLLRTLTLCFTWTPGCFEACDLEAQEISHWGVGLQPPLFAAIPRICKSWSSSLSSGPLIKKSQELSISSLNFLSHF